MLSPRLTTVRDFKICVVDISVDLFRTRPLENKSVGPMSLHRNSELKYTTPELGKSGVEQLWQKTSTF